MALSPRNLEIQQHKGISNNDPPSRNHMLLVAWLKRIIKTHKHILSDQDILKLAERPPAVREMRIPL